MKTNVSYFCQQFRHTYEGEPWYGDSLRHKLESVSASEAFALPAPGVHSVAQLVAHMLAWRQLLVERLKGNGDFRIESDSVLDWPPCKPKDGPICSPNLKKIRRNCFACWTQKRMNF